MVRNVHHAIRLCSLKRSNEAKLSRVYCLEIMWRMLCGFTLFYFTIHNLSQMMRDQSCIMSYMIPNWPVEMIYAYICHGQGKGSLPHEFYFVMLLISAWHRQGTAGCSRVKGPNPLEHWKVDVYFQILIESFKGMRNFNWRLAKEKKTEESVWMCVDLWK